VADEVKASREKLIPFQKLEDRMLWIRLLGSVVMLLDISMKISYVNASRFASIEIKNLY
jgi:hypothetical protein